MANHEDLKDREKKMWVFSDAGGQRKNADRLGPDQGMGPLPPAGM
jgi:hypothetical protein